MLLQNLLQTSCSSPHFACSLELCIQRTKKSFVSLPQQSHAFHRSCLLEWLETRDDCPCCRAAMVVTDEELMHGTADDDDALVGVNGRKTRARHRAAAEKVRRRRSRRRRHHVRRPLTA